MLKPAKFKFCPQCGSGMEPAESAPLHCPSSDCNFTFWNNPTPVVAAIVERPDGVVLAHNVGWPPKMYGLITGFLEQGESPASAVLREVEEELNLTSGKATLVGSYGFPQMNQVIIAYHVAADGDIELNEELDDYRVVPREKLKPWPFGTGEAVRDWLLSEGITP